jgi:rod shape-determining protein MreC
MEHTPPPFFNRGPSPLVRLLICAALSLTLLTTDLHYRYLENIRQVVAVALYPLQRLVDAPGALLSRLSDIFITLSTLREDKARLEALALRNAVALQKQHALESENANLRNLLGMREHFGTDTIAAEIAYQGRDPFAQQIIIDKGERGHVEPGQPAIDRSGLIGQVTRVYPWLAEITLITDNKQTVSVQNLRNGLRALLTGTGQNGQLELKFIPLSADFQAGDQLVTSGIDGVYPPGLPVAAVTNVERNPTYLFANIACKPLTGVGNYRQVLLLNWKNPAAAVPEPEVKPARSKKGKPDPS